FRRRAPSLPPLGRKSGSVTAYNESHVRSMLNRKISKSGRRGRLSAEIARRIQQGIGDGSLAPGERLPAERELAQKLEVSRVSVREAYRSLAELGLLEIKRGSEGGAFISDVDHQPVTKSLSMMLRLGRTSLEEL